VLVLAAIGVDACTAVVGRCAADAHIGGCHARRIANLIQ
jgi:hypothetical protein